MSEPTEYDVSRPAVAEIIGVLVACPSVEAREDMAADLLAKFDREEITYVLCAAIGMANAVVANNREMIEQHLLDAGDWQAVDTPHPINLPTMLGAVQGAILARGIDAERTCGGCAFRQGTCANTSLITTADAKACVGGDVWMSHDTFYCHQKMDEKNQPTEPCRGYAQAAAAQRKASE